MKTYLYLDDFRDKPELPGFDVTKVASFGQFVEYLEQQGMPDVVSFDYDLGLPVAIAAQKEGMSKRKAKLLKRHVPTGADCAQYMVEFIADKKIKYPFILVHSQNKDGREKIKAIICSY